MHSQVCPENRLKVTFGGKTIRPNDLNYVFRQKPKRQSYKGNLVLKKTKLVSKNTKLLYTSLTVCYLN